MANTLWKLPFGKYRGKDLEDVPNSYLEWLLEQNFFCDKFHDKVPTIEKELMYRERFDINVEDDSYEQNSKRDR